MSFLTTNNGSKDLVVVLVPAAVAGDVLLDVERRVARPRLVRPVDVADVPLQVVRPGKVLSAILFKQLR